MPTPSSLRPTPVGSRKVTPVQPLPLQSKKSVAVAVDLSKVNNQLESLSIAPLAVAPLAFKRKPVVPPTPTVPILRSCLKTSVSKAKGNNRVRWVPTGGWNSHEIRVFEVDAPPTSFFDFESAVLFRPIIHKNVQHSNHLIDDGCYMFTAPNRELRWPHPEDPLGDVKEGSQTRPRWSCR